MFFVSVIVKKKEKTHPKSSTIAKTQGKIEQIKQELVEIDNKINNLIWKIDDENLSLVKLLEEDTSVFKILYNNTIIKNRIIDMHYKLNNNIKYRKIRQKKDNSINQYN